MNWEDWGRLIPPGIPAAYVLTSLVIWLNQKSPHGRRFAVASAWLALGLTTLLAVFVLRDAPRLDDVNGPTCCRTNWLWLSTFIEQEGANFVPQSTSEETSPGWRLIGPDVRLSFGIDRATLWLLWGTVAVVLAYLSLQTNSNGDYQHLATVMLTAGALSLVWVAVDFVLQTVALGLAAMAFIALTCQTNRDRSMGQFGWCWYGYLPSTILWLVGWLLLVTSVSTMRTISQLRPRPYLCDVSEILASVLLIAARSQEAAQYWQDYSAGISFWFGLAFFLRLGLPPFHWISVRGFDERSSVITPLILLSMQPLAIYGWQRILLPLFGLDWSESAPMMISVFGAITFWSALLVANRGAGPFATVALRWLAIPSGVAMTGLFSLAPSAASAGLKLVCFEVWLIAAAMLLMQRAGVASSITTSDEFVNLRQRFPRAVGGTALAVLLAIGMPLSGYAGGLDIAVAVMRYSWGVCLVLMVSWLIAASGLLKWMAELLSRFCERDNHTIIADSSSAPTTLVELSRTTDVVAWNETWTGFSAGDGLSSGDHPIIPRGGMIEHSRSVVEIHSRQEAPHDLPQQDAVLERTRSDLSFAEIGGVLPVFVVAVLFAVLPNVVLWGFPRAIEAPAASEEGATSQRPSARGLDRLVEVRPLETSGGAE